MSTVPVVEGGLPDVGGGLVVTDARSRAGSWVRGRLWVAFSAAWLVGLAYPFAEAWAAPASTARVASLGAVVVFGAVYLWALGAAHGWGGHLPPRLAWRFLTAELALVGVMTLAAHGAGLAGLVFVAVTGVFVLTTRPALALVAVVAVVGEVVPVLVPGWHSLNGLAVQCALAGMAIYGYRQLVARNRELVRARQELADVAVARERERMARDVHDILGHSLTVITVKSELAGKLLAAGAFDRATAEIADVESLARAALADVRATVSGLRQVGLASELASARSALRAAGIVPTLPSATAEVPEQLRELFAWTVREGTTNVIRHSGAGRCEITLTAQSASVRDDGRGPGWNDDPLVGNGLIGLRERAAARGAQVAVGPVPGGGYELTVCVGEPS
ncbi:sensor histidine kinase [Pengzhenrongella phosphoraccumulans]|uniref:sensor histidine kinase n=1 Tax=Pengzhenrongella phosphoraccumulans TaxID=3114394 RepID=UPI00388D790F